jgi:branched-chain amino acid transport system substrate-binding protein
MKRAGFLTLSFVVALTLAAASGAPALAQELSIGFLVPRTGILAQIGKDMTDGFNMYLEEKNGQFAGQKVRLVVEDTTGSANTAVTKANKLILSDKVNMLVGGVLATTGYALAPVSTREKILYLGSIATADDLAQRDFDKYPYMVRPTFVPSQPSHPFGQWACEQGYKRIAIIAADYAFGHETAGGFQKAFEDCGGRVVQKIWPPFGTKDFGPYIPTIKSDIDAVFALMVGPMTLQFPKQLRASGFKKPILGGGTNYDEFILPAMGDEVIGDVSSHLYSSALETPKNIAFVKKYREKYGKVPSYYSEANYTTAQWIDETLKKLGGKYPGPTEFIKTMQTVKLDAVRGPIHLDDRLTVVQNIYIKTYPAVSQFWTYKPAEFLKQPVYSREFPPCKYCN